jgi:hypothetical protein
MQLATNHGEEKRRSIIKREGNGREGKTKNKKRKGMEERRPLGRYSSLAD